MKGRETEREKGGKERDTERYEGEIKVDRETDGGGREEGRIKRRGEGKRKGGRKRTDEK